MAMTDEKELENHLRDVIETRITAANPSIYALKNKKAVDIVICRDGASPAVFFLGVKLFKSTSNRLGIGGGKGSGYQPEIIDRHPDYFESHLRWIIVDGRQPALAYLFIPTSVVRQFLAKGELGVKQNNIQRGIFRGVPAITEDALVTDLREWLLA